MEYWLVIALILAAVIYGIGKLNDKQKEDRSWNKSVDDWQEREKAQKQFAEKQARTEEAERKLVRQDVRKHTQKHLTVLMRKHRQTVHPDAYGRPVVEDWYRELEYFVDRVLAEEYDPGDYGMQYLDSMHYWITRKHRDVAVTCVHDCVVEAMLQESTGGTAFDEGMSGADFEQFCAEELTKYGWTVRLVGKSGDQGGDLIAEREAHRVVVQCKKYSSPVGNAAVREALAARHFHEGTAACVVSNALYTKAAEQLAATSGVHLLHYSRLDQLDDLIG